jgi:deoxycytidylate deaminase
MADIMVEYAKDCELVIGLASPVGVNHDDVESRLRDIFGQFNYEVNYIHLSELVSKHFDKRPPKGLKENDRLDWAMETGTELRNRYGRGDLYALMAMDEINLNRASDHQTVLPRKRTVHVIRSLKHAEEVNTLRQVYGQGFFLLGVSASTESKKHYLRELKGVEDESELDRLIQRDDKEVDKLGQQTRNVFQLADAFATTDDNTRLSKQLGRIVDLIFSHPYQPPTEEEYAMFMAYAASLRSADLSRQVGAVLTNDMGDIVSTGANDVPKFGGGLYWPGEDDCRDYVRKEDSNEMQRNRIMEEVIESIVGKGVDKAEIETYKSKLSKTRIGDLTEFGRAVHAEMEALLQASRNGISIRGARLYTTTFPCHNCAKHIVVSGAKEVVYIEPYPKSFATTLHDDSINDLEEPVLNKVNFRQFVGIGPRKFIDLFSMNLGNGRKIKRKENGVVVSWSRGTAELRVPMSPLSYLESETDSVNLFSSLVGGRNE